MKNQCNLFWLALSFYTRLPCPKNLDYSQLPQAASYLPLIGWMVGGISAMTFYLAALVWTPTIAVLIALSAGMFITGAFHEDGLADVFDGFGGGWEKAQIFMIMKDSRVGTYGAASLLMMISLKVATLTALPVAKIPLILFAGHSVSRFFPLWLMRHYEYTRTEDSKTGSAMVQPSWRDLLFAGLCASVPLLFLPALCLTAIFPAFCITLCLGRYFYRHIGGYTGDCLGATQQISETVFYLSVSALWKFI